MVNYQNGKVYKIIDENYEIVYIGSTAQELLCDRYKNHPYKASNHKIILIENYPCNSKQELCMREQQIIEEHSNLLNKNKAYITEEEKKNYIKEKRKEYYENDKEFYKQKSKKYRQKNKDILNQKNKEWRDNNKEYLKQYKKEHYEKLKQNKIICEFCNCEVLKKYLKKHQQTKKCLKFQSI